MTTENSLDSKLVRFERLAQRRVNAAIKQLRLIGNLANRRNYEFTESHLRQILDALDAEMRSLKHRFRDEGAAGGQEFSFRK